MPNNYVQRLAGALAGPKNAPMQGPPPPWMSEPGLEEPPEMKALHALNTIATGYGMGQMGAGLAGALITKGLPAWEALGETGGISLPENMKLPPGMTKGELLTPSEQAYHINEMNEKQYLHNEDFVNALKAKWGMLKNAGGN